MNVTFTQEWTHTYMIYVYFNVAVNSYDFFFLPIFHFSLLNEVLCLLFSAMYYSRKYVLWYLSSVILGVALEESILMLLRILVVSGVMLC